MPTPRRGIRLHVGGGCTPARGGIAMRRNVISVLGSRSGRAALALALAGGLMMLASQDPSAAQGPPSPAESTITLSNDPAVLTGQPGSGSFSATVTFLDASGDPVSDEQVIMVVEDTTSHENMSTLVPNNGQESTDANGQATYAISCASLGCSP